MNDEEQPSVAAAAAAADNGNAAEDMDVYVAYIDRIVRGVDAEANLSAERCPDDEEDSEEGSIFSLDEEYMESDEASVSDDDFEDDADEDDIAVRIMPLQAAFLPVNLLKRAKHSYSGDQARKISVTGPLR